MKTPKVYVASSIKNYERVLDIERKVVAIGGQITFSWASDVSQSKIEDEVRLKELAVIERNAVKEADILFLVLPGGRGAHVEFGMACALYKPVFLINDKSEHIMFYLLPNVHVFQEEKAALIAFVSYLV